VQGRRGNPAALFFAGKTRKSEAFGLCTAAGYPSSGMPPTSVPQTMQAAFVRKTRVGLEEVAVPVPGPGELLIEVLRCGICGSDLHMYGGGGNTSVVCPGHEILGRVIGKPPTGSAFERGDRVTVEATRTCAGCPACRRGDGQLCENLEILGVHRPGGFADFVVAQPRQLHFLPDQIDDTTGALTEPLAVAVHAARIAGGVAGRRVLVIGAGSIGLLTAFVARQSGAAQIAITARRSHQSEAASQLGIDEILAPGAKGAPFDIVFETVGGRSDTTLAEAVLRTRPGGRTILLGLFPTPPRLPALELMSREIQLYGANCYGKGTEGSDFERAHRLLAEHGALLRDTLVTHCFALEQIRAAFDTAADKTTGSIKVQVCCG
jgi:2-desacetyl-2-hydroxyethyl bacteriochlorophyllide A dehydrogenase